MTYYVSPYGSDRNDGSQAAPFATLQRGVDAAQPGDAIIVMDGAYAPTGGTDSMGVNVNKAGSAGAPITLQAQGGAAVLDGQGVAHSWINFQGGAAWWNVIGFEIRNTRWGGVWSNSGGGRNILIRGNRIHHIGNRYEAQQIGICGIYTDGGAQAFTVDGNTIHDIGRTNDAGNGFDHGVYSHGNLDITGNQFYNALSGFFIQCASGFSGSIRGNTFTGKDQYPGVQGAVMLWDAAGGPIEISGNTFVDPQGPAIVDYNFSGQVTITGNQVSGSGSIGGPSNAITTTPAAIAPMPTIQQVSQSPIYQTFTPQTYQEPAQQSPALLGPPEQAPMPTGTMLAIGAVALALILAN